MGFGKEDVKSMNKKIGLREVKCSLEVGMRIVASRDLKRRDKKKEWNELLKENLIDDEDHSATWQVD